jgi:transcription initiation factor TFIIH subunit 2
MLNRHLPPHGSREVIIIMGSLTTCDPGNVHETIEATVKDRIRVNIIGLSAEMKICKDICTSTKGSSFLLSLPYFLLSYH